jgi:hypothetical protein
MYLFGYTEINNMHDNKTGNRNATVYDVCVGRHRECLIVDRTG